LLHIQVAAKQDQRTQHESPARATSAYYTPDKIHLYGL